jgi:23S rRNA pseudouridine955/2504/2580 synthase
VRVVQVDAGHAGRRLDNFLGSVLEGAPRPLVYRVIRSGEVRVNGRRATPDCRLALGDQVRIPPFTARAAGPRAIPEGLLARIERQLLHEDEDLIVVDKPPGLAVHGGSGLDFGLVDVLRELRPGAGRIDLVHRLDRDTSGCLLFARNPVTLRALHRLLREGGMVKGYLALLAGSLPNGALDCRAPLAMEPDRHGERHAVVRPDGASAHTVFTAQRRYAGATLAEVALDTGRTHQIRAHAAWLGHAVAGDSRYGAPEFNRRLHALGLRRLFLHAARLSFRLDRVYAFQAPLPEELAGVLASLAADR